MNECIATTNYQKSGGKASMKYARNINSTLSVRLAISGLTVLALLVGRSVSAQPLESCLEYVQITWDAPTTLENGNPLDSPIAGYELLVEANGTQYVIAVDGAATSFTHDNPVDTCGAGQANYGMATVLEDGRVGNLSDLQTLTFAGGYQGKESIPATINFTSGSVEQKNAITVPSCDEINQFGCKRGN